MKKKIGLILCVLVAVAAAFGLCACDNAVNGNGDNKPSNDTHTHSYVNYEYNNDATCAKDGTETAKCEYCDKTDTRTKNGTATGIHSYGDDDICDVCGYDKSSPIVHTHTLSYFIERAATCTTDGNVEYWQCSDCKKYYSDNKGENEINDYVIKKLNHDIVDHEAKAATCTVVGWDEYETCSRCDYTTYNEINALGHNVQTHEAKTATCAEVGWDAYETCSRCDYTTYNEIAKLQHEYENYCCVNCYDYDPAYDVTKGLSYTAIYRGDEIIAYTVSGIGSVVVGEIVIPQYYKSKPVTRIEREAFRGCSSLTSIKIPNSVISIRSNAFEDCNSLTIYCEAESQQSGYDNKWNSSSCPVVWNCNNNNTDSKGYAYTVFNGVRYRLKNGIATVIGQPSNLASAIIAASVSYNGTDYSVTGIGQKAFSGCGSLTSVIIGNNVTTIESDAFSDCRSLTIYCEVESQPSGYSSYWNYPAPVVWDCNNNDTDANGYAYTVFNGVRYRLKDGVAAAVGQPSNIASAIIASSVSYEGTDYSVTSIEEYAFKGCNSLTSATIPNSVTIIGDCAFGGEISGCISLTNVIIGTGVTSIGYYAFAGCISLKSIEIPNSVTSIGGSAFGGCSSLASVTLGNSVTSIYGSAFYNCKSLTSIEIPNSVTSIGGSAFSGCISLTSIAVQNGNAKYHSSGNCIIETEGKTLLVGCKSSIIPADGSVTSIAERAFSGCGSITSIEIPNSVTNVGNYAFYGCKSLTIYCEAESKPVGYGSEWRDLDYSNNSSSCPVVWNCNNNNTDVNGYAYTVLNGVRYRLKNGIATVIIQPSDIASAIIESCVAYNGTDYNVTSIVEYAFEGCISLTSASIPGSVTSIGNYAFEGCSNLTSVTISNGVTSIGQYAFQNCSSLTSIEMPLSVASIGDHAFEGCSGLTDLKISNNVSIIGYGVFSDCSSLTSVTIPGSVTSIWSGAFEGCSSLISVEIPNSVTRISNHAFRYCSNLSVIKYKSTLTRWEEISKDSDWDYYTNNYTVICTNGTLYNNKV